MLQFSAWRDQKSSREKEHQGFLCRISCREFMDSNRDWRGQMSNSIWCSDFQLELYFLSVFSILQSSSFTFRFLFSSLRFLHHGNNSSLSIVKICQKSQETMDWGPKQWWRCKSRRMDLRTQLCYFFCFIFWNATWQFFEVLGLRLEIQQWEWSNFSNHCPMLTVKWWIIDWFQQSESKMNLHDCWFT